MTPDDERRIVLGTLELIRQFLNASTLKTTDGTFYYRVKDFCADTINHYRDDLNPERGGRVVPPDWHGPKDDF